MLPFKIDTITVPAPLKAKASIQKIFFEPLYHGAFQYIFTMGAFNIYVNKQRWVGGEPNVYAYKVNTLFLFTIFVYQGWVGGSKKRQRTVLDFITWFLGTFELKI